MNNVKLGIVSGYFNPIHKGHIEYINAAKDCCDYLICVVNNDDQVRLKGSKFFMDENHRLIIVKNLKSIDAALISIDQDRSISQTLNKIFELKKDSNIEFVFFNSGDAMPENSNQKEIEVCLKNNIRREFINLPKTCSSSKLKANLTSDDIK